MLKRLLTIALSVSLLTSLCNCKTFAPASGLEKSLERYISDKNARIGVAVILDTEDTIAVNGHRDFPMMSVYKFPIALAVASWADSTGTSLNDSIAISKNALLEDTYSPMRDRYGRKDLRLSIYELLSWALKDSDNNASDILLDMIGGADSAMAILSREGISNNILIGATEKEMHDNHYMSYMNRSTPLDMASLMFRFQSHIKNRSESFHTIWQILGECRTGTDRLAAPLQSTDATLYHKTGTGFVSPEGNISALNDCGVVILGNGRRYSIAVFTADSGYDAEKTATLIAEISAMVYDHVNNCAPVIQ